MTTFLELDCPLCGQAREGAIMVRCLRCSTPHHHDCWRYAGACTTFGCGSRHARVHGCDPREDPLELGTRYSRMEQGVLDVVRPCPICKSGWKDETGVRCGCCGTLYHETCFEGLGGCTTARCRATRRIDPKSSRPSLVLGVAAQLCRLCTEALAPRESVSCPNCSRPYHRGCWVANQGCLRFECREKRRIAAA